MSQVKIDGQEYSIDEPEPTGEQLLALAGKQYPEWALHLRHGQQTVSVGKDQQVVLADLGDSVFSAVPGAGQKGGEGKDPRTGAVFPIHIKIDGEEYEVSVASLTGKEILALAGKSFDDWSLNQKLLSGRRVKVDKDTVIDLTSAELDRFETAPLQVQQGGAGWRF